MKILTIETTCDETAAAVVTDQLEVLSSVVASQEDLHRRYGGVVPELASRAHVERILPVIHETLERAGVRGEDLAAVAVATTPGLAGSLLVGLSAAKALALGWGVPLVAVNHLHAHIYACRLAAGEEVFPCVGLIASGGHSSLYHCHTALEFDLLGGTIDDAAGEAFDKVANLLGLGFPGGPAIERAARDGNPAAFDLPRPLLKDDTTLDFSFSGLKTAVRYRVSPPGEQTPSQRSPGQKSSGQPSSRQPSIGQPLSEIASWPRQRVADLAAAFQAAVVDCLVGKAMLALDRTGLTTLCIGGGVAANTLLRERLGQAAQSRGIRLIIPPMRLCTDNAVMGAIALERLKAGFVDRLDIDIRPGLVRR